jgi:hypothetical protein
MIAEHLTVVGQRMSEAEYDAERAKLAPDKAAAAVRWEQALAVLFARSNWTQDMLAKKEGKTRQWVSLRLCFGGFLNFATTVAKAESIPNNLTERRFRSLWELTDKAERNERVRFQEVLKLIREDTRISKPPSPKGYPKIIREHFADGQWHPLADIAEKLEEPDHAAVERSLYGMDKLGSADIEKRLRGRDQHTEYRIFPREKTVSASELAEKLGPLIKSLKAEGKKSMAAMVPANVAMFADLLQRLLDEWTASPE